jgi:GTPase KRas protein
MLCLKSQDADWWPVVLVGNKCDLEEREVTTEEGKALAKEWNAPFLESSARFNLNVEESFFELVRALRKLEGDKNPAEPAPTKMGKKSKK